MKYYLKSWGFMRALHLILGIFIIVQGILAKEWMFIILGGLFSLLPLMNMGCCGAMDCYTSTPKTNNKIEDITYEEVR